MYVAGIMDHFSSAPRMELFVWSSTMGWFVLSGFRTYNQVKRSRSTAGRIKPGSTGPGFWTNLALFGQGVGFFVPPLIYGTTTAYNNFQQPEWMTAYALPSPPDVVGVDGVIVGRTAGLLVFLAASIFGRIALKVLGDQYHPIGVSDPIVACITGANQRLTFVPDGR
jgi:hypothetical protein